MSQSEPESKPEIAREGQRGPEREPERAREGQREPERAGQRARESQSEPEGARERKRCIAVEKLQLCIWKADYKREAGHTSLACLNIVLLQNG